MDLNRLSTLKEKLVDAEDFGDPWDFFFDHFGEDPEFFECGERTESSLLKAVLTRIGQELFGDDATTTEPTLVELQEHHFIHGSCFIQGRLTVVIFFSDIDMGLLSVLDPTKGDHYTALVRFSSYQMESDKVVSFAPTMSKAIH